MTDQQFRIGSIGATVTAADAKGAVEAALAEGWVFSGTVAVWPLSTGYSAREVFVVQDGKVSLPPPPEPTVQP